MAIQRADLKCGRIFGAALDDVLPAVGAHDIGWIVSAINEATMLETPEVILPTRHLKLALNDINERREGLVAPEGGHVQRLVQFVDDWDQKLSLLVHCWAGVSRSSACVFISLCHLNPDMDEKDIAMILRKASPTATPNALLVQLADDYLGRSGKMVDAVDMIGQGQMTYQGALYSLPANLTTLDEGC